MLKHVLFSIFLVVSRNTIVAKITANTAALTNDGRRERLVTRRQYLAWLPVDAHCAASGSLGWCPAKEARGQAPFQLLCAWWNSTEKETWSLKILLSPDHRWRGMHTYYDPKDVGFPLEDKFFQAVRSWSSTEESAVLDAQIQKAWQPLQRRCCLSLRCSSSTSICASPALTPSQLSCWLWTHGLRTHAWQLILTLFRATL